MLRNQRGGALIFVSIVGLVMSIGFTLFMSSTILAEQRAVEAQLAKLRVYWAQMGMFNYALSRTSYSALCDNACGSGNKSDTYRANVLQAYFNELSANATWTYPDEASGYSFTTAATAAVDETPGRQNFSGWIKATASYTPSALLNSAAPKLPLMELRFCAGLDDDDDECGWIANNNGGQLTRYFSISRLTNLPSP